MNTSVGWAVTLLVIAGPAIVDLLGNQFPDDIHLGSAVGCEDIGDRVHAAVGRLGDLGHIVLHDEARAICSTLIDMRRPSSVHVTPAAM